MRFAWLDGLRGLAALYVLIYHAAEEIPRSELRSNLSTATAWMHKGHLAVTLFIVLSGFSLMLPVAREGRLRPGYFRRRARRILPPYYAALVLSLGLIATVPWLQNSSDPVWETALPAFDPVAIGSHLLLVHNLRHDLVFRINPPMWSVATEWQIYFLFPLLIGIWRRYGVSAVVLAGTVVCVGLRLVFDRLSWAAMAPWYVVVFAFGMVAAVEVRAPEDRPIGPSDQRRWPTLVAFGLGLLTIQDRILLDYFAGALAGALMVYLGRCCLDDGFRPVVLRLLESSGALALGAFSYSIYLVHYPFLPIARAIMVRAHLDANVQLALMLGAVCPLVVAIAYGFHLLFERPFMPAHPRSLRGAERAATVSPAP